MAGVCGFLMRQGYYSAVPETSKNHMSEGRIGLLVLMVRLLAGDNAIRKVTSSRKPRCA